MDSRDFRIVRLTDNLQHLAQCAAEYSRGESERTRAAVEALRRQLQRQQDEEAVQRKRRPRAAVVCWDLGHNPVGRAYVLYELLRADYEVELIGPMWSRYGKSIWSPLADADLRTRSFRCDDLLDFVPKAELLAATRTYDLVWVCKPRLPSLYLGALLKDGSDCPLICDVDDFELSFFGNETSLELDAIRADARAALIEPYEEAATRFAQTLIASADAVTVSNVALQRRFGGHVVRHARDEDKFRNSVARRETARAQLGIEPDQFALMFIGTPRAHKGVAAVAAALHTLNDPTIEFHIVGQVSDTALRESLAAASNARVVVHPNCAFDALPDLLAGADLVPLIQDLSHPISEYQIPAKVSDALALGIPVIATDAPPLADLIASGAVHVTSVDTLAQTIADWRANACAEETRRARRHFENELGMGVNRLRFAHALQEARDAHAASTETLGGDTRLAPTFAAAVDLVRETYRETRATQVQSVRGTGTDPIAARVSAERQTGDKSRRRLGHFLKPRPGSYDVAFFWKQNDSGLYGRRSDMIARYLAASDRIGRVVHFDAPVSAPSLDQHFQHGGCEPNGQQDLILRSIVDRGLALHDTEKMVCRTFLGSGRPSRPRFFGKPVPAKEAYVRYVRDEIEAAGLRPDRTVAWLCPIVWDAVDLIHKVGFAGVVADVIDDQRGWEDRAGARSRLEQNYRNVLPLADLVLTNCDALANTMAEFRDGIHVVPNGAERFTLLQDDELPAVLAGIPRPIVGYVGNLRDRIDWLLLHELVPAMPDVSFVFFGPSNDSENAKSLAKHSNVHMPGVLPYDDLARHLRAFDVGMVPHLNNRLTASMNPLKVYNYFAAGLPIVSCGVGNLEDLGDALQTADTAGEFAEAIRRALENPVDTADAAWQSTMDRIAWDTRVDEIITLLDASLTSKLRRSA